MTTAQKIPATFSPIYAAISTSVAALVSARAKYKDTARSWTRERVYRDAPHYRANVGYHATRLQGFRRTLAEHGIDVTPLYRMMLSA